jgi:hypothetical protein
MSIETTLKEIKSGLKKTRFKNKQLVFQGVVLPVLRELGWDIYDANIVAWQEYQARGEPVDCALCHPPLQPAVFIAVKEPGEAEDVDSALLCALFKEVPLVVLTDGGTWNFYSIAGQDRYEEICRISLSECAPAKAKDTLRRYLNRQRVELGEAQKVARKNFQRQYGTSRAREMIPETWRELVEKREKSLVNVLANAIRLKTGVRPREDDVIEFLVSLSGTTVTETPVKRAARNPRRKSERPCSERERRHGNLRLRDKEYVYRNANEELVIILRELAKEDPSFLERCSGRSEVRGRKRRYIARSVEELYPGRPDLYKHHKVLPGGWVVGTNLNNVLKQEIFQLAKDVAGLSGRDIEGVEF